MVFRHVQPSRIGRGLRARYLGRHVDDFGKALQHFVLPLGIGNVLRQRDARIRDGHMNMMSPSLSGGMNSLPMPEARTTAPTRKTTEIPSVMAR